MRRMYKRFIFHHYRTEHPEIHAAEAQIDWQLDDRMDDGLPVMQSGITLTGYDKRRVLIMVCPCDADSAWSAHAAFHESVSDIHLCQEQGSGITGASPQNGESAAIRQDR